MNIITGNNINIYRMKVLLSALKLELLGMKRSRGLQTAYSIIKHEYNLKGSKQKVYNQFETIINNK